jgi:ATP-binding cassette subfamily B multidrug efflux pump
MGGDRAGLVRSPLRQLPRRRYIHRMARLWLYVGRYRLRYLGGIVCLIGATALAMATPPLFGHCVNAIAQDAGSRVLLGYLGLIVIIALAQAVARTFSRFVIFNAGRDIEYDLRNDLFTHLESLPLAFYQQRQTGDLMSRLVNDVTAVRMLLGPGLLNFINTPVAYLCGLAVMLHADVRLTLLALSVYPAALLVVKRMSRLLMERTLRVQEGLGQLSSQVQENLSGMHVVKSYACEGHETETFAHANERFQELNLRLARVRGFLFPVMGIVSGAGSLVVLVYGGRQVMAGRLSVGDLVMFIGFLYQLAWPTMALGWMLSILQRGRAAMQRLNEVFAIAPAIASPPGATAPTSVAGEVTLRGVGFRYPGRADGAPVLEDIDLTIPAGRTVAIVGRTGSGKSTLVQLLPRLFDVSAGAILLDGRDIRTLPLGWLRRQVGLVPQDPFLFSRSIHENVGLALDGEGNGHVDWAVRMAALSRDLADFPDGLDTIVGERGVTLSGGQKQRAAIARAVFKDPRILLLDDALSSVDTHTEEQILHQLRDVLEGRTALIVSHRVSTVRDADSIVVLDDGRIVEQGTHAELVHLGGLYAAMYRRQLLSEELDVAEDEAV